MDKEFDLGNELMTLEEKKENQADKLIKIASAYKLFHDDTKEPYAIINNECLKVRSSSFKQLLAREMYRSYGKAPNSDSLNQALNVIEAQARYDGQCIKLHNRVAEFAGDFYYDLSNGKAVRITDKGWQTVETFPVLFRRFSHQQAQVEPQRGGNINDLFNFLNVRNERHRLLILVYLIACFIPGIPHPIFHPYGDQGSGKTTMFVFFKILIDPSKLSVLITPRDSTELVQILDHHYLCLFDNLSSFPDWLSDLLSQACTGGGFSKRKLYSDDDDIIFQIMRCIGMNGINLLIGKPDLMDRTILLHLERIEPSQRKEWKVILKDFENVRPYLLGCLFDVLSEARRIYPSIALEQLPRMADFVKWGVAIAQALGYSAQDFLSAYQGNVESQNAEIINGNTLAQAVLSFMENQDKWEGTVKEAYDNLSPLVTVSKEDRTFPKHYNKLRHSLNRIKPNLLDFGVKFTIADYNTRRGVFMSFQKVGKLPFLSSPCSQSNEIKGLCRDDREDREDQLKVSSHAKLLKNKDCEDCEDREDKIGPFWEGGQEGINLEEVEVMRWST